MDLRVKVLSKTEALNVKVTTEVDTAINAMNVKVGQPRRRPATRLRSLNSTRQERYTVMLDLYCQYDIIHNMICIVPTLRPTPSLMEFKTTTHTHTLTWRLACLVRDLLRKRKFSVAFYLSPQFHRFSKYSCG